MASGKIHERINLFGSIIAVSAVGAIAKEPILGLLVGAGTLVGTYLLSPDLDCRGAFHAKSWWRWHRIGLGWYWSLYAQTIPHHRHWLSHSIVISTAYRVLWLAIPLAAILYALPLEIDPNAIITTHWRFFAAFYGGLELSTILHLLMDL
jgi:uncharacterized metal-binding protein